MLRFVQLNGFVLEIAETEKMSNYDIRHVSIRLYWVYVATMAFRSFYI